MKGSIFLLVEGKMKSLAKKCRQRGILHLPLTYTTMIN